MASTVEQMREREEFWSGHIDRMQESGMRHQSYCDEQGLKIHTLRYWTVSIRPHTPTTILP